MLPLIHCTLSLKCMKHSSKKIECLLFVLHILSSRHQPKCTSIDLSNNYLIGCSSFILITDNCPTPRSSATVYAGGWWVVDVSKVVGGTFNFTPCNHRGSYWPYCQSGAAWDRTKIEGSNPESAMTWYPPGYLCLITRSHLINMIPGVIGSR